MQLHTFSTISHEVDFCVVGGGMAGLIAAVSAARHGAQVLLLQDRPVLGGNASSEVRMWICGARGSQAKETGLLEEIMLANYYRNANLNYSLWDTVLYEKARYQPGLTLLLNCACQEVITEGDPQASHIVAVKGWQTTTQTFHQVRAKYFADCSGDSVLRICGAEFRRGRESRHEFGESHAPEEADARTMGNTLLIQAREHDRPTPPFISPSWAYKFEEEDITTEQHQRNLGPTGDNFWWIELGGMGDTIGQAEELRDDLLRTAFGVWDMIQNHPDGRARNWELEWIGALPGKRESIRYVGDHILTQADVLAAGQFDDLVAYGGWTMDDHHPAGIAYRGPATVFHETPSPFGIPYRCLYSKNIDNLFFAGRNISTTHMAMSATRVMATCAVCGQAVGTAAALAVKHFVTPRQVGQQHIRELQNLLMDDDAYLPWHARPVAEISRLARLEVTQGDAEPLRNGIDRSLGEADNGWWASANDTATYTFPSSVHLSHARLTFDSHLADNKRMPCWYSKEGNHRDMPPMLPRAFAIEIQDARGVWQRLHLVENNHQRLVRLPLDIEASAVRFVPLEAWGENFSHIMAFEVR